MSQITSYGGGDLKVSMDPDPEPENCTPEWDAWFARTDGFERPRDAPDQESPVCWLPHSCDEWIVGGVAEAKALIADLERFVAEAEAVRT